MSEALRSRALAPWAAQLEAACLLLLACAMTAPLWSVAYPSIQDLPQHLAAISVLHHYDDPRWAFARHFTLDLTHTQYLAYYALVRALGFVVDLDVANRIVMSGCLVALPLSLRALSRSLGFEGRAAWLVLPLTYNAQLILGFFNFLLALPLALYGLSLAVRMRREAWRWPRAVWLALVMLACFYAHVVPFAFLAVGAGLLGLSWHWKASALRWAPLLPSALAALAWLRSTPAGQATMQAAQAGTEGAHVQHAAVFRPAAVAWRDLPNWLTDMFHSADDLMLLEAWAALVACVGVLGAVFMWRDHSRGASREPEARAGLRAWGLLCGLLPLACVGYFVLPSGYTWIWPIAERFALLSAVWLCALVPWPRGRLAYPLIAACIALSVLHLSVVQRAFERFDTVEVADFDRALAAIPAAKKVAGLIFARGSTEVKLSPFLHYVAYYQAKKGGAVMFTFADFPQSPFEFRTQGRPPTVPPRWEWTPERVDPARQLGYYDYVLVRAGPGRIAQQRDTYDRVYSGRRWSVWRRKTPAAVP